VWLFGGLQARSDMELAERWSSSQADALGTIAAATESAFPGDADVAHPEYAFPQVLTLAFGEGSHALIAAQLPPACDEEGRPHYPPTSVRGAAPACDKRTLSQCFVVEAATGSTQPCSLPHAHVAGAASALDPTRGVLTGGMQEGSSDVSDRVTLVALDAAATPSFDADHTLHQARALHSSTGLYDGGVLSVGGVTWQRGTPLLVSATTELLWF
jgi:hypothetical protein